VVDARGRRWAWAAAIAWAALLFALSATPGDPDGFDWPLLSFPGADKVAHAALYAVLGATLRLATGRTGLAVVWAGAYGVSDEVHQAFVPGRSPDPWDWLADVVGAWVGATVVARAARRAPRRTVE
jgi:hypothetical protein